MDSAGLLMGIIPLLVFVIVDSFAGMKAALISAVIFALIEAGLSLYLFKEVDLVTGVSIGLVIVLSAVSYFKNSDKFFKFQPVILSLIISLLLISTYFMGKPFLYEMTFKYIDHFPEQLRTQLSHPFVQEVLKLATLYVGVSFIVHGLFTAYTALKMNKWWWIAMRGIGFYIFMAIGMFAAQFVIAARYNSGIY